MIVLGALETEQLKLLKKEIMNMPAGEPEYPRVLLSEYGQAPIPRVVRRLVEEIDAGVETRIKKEMPKKDEWRFYWD